MKTLYHTYAIRCSRAILALLLWFSFAFQSSVLLILAAIYFVLHLLGEKNWYVERAFSKLLIDLGFAQKFVSLTQRRHSLAHEWA